MPYLFIIYYIAVELNIAFVLFTISIYTNVYIIIILYYYTSFLNLAKILK